MAYSLTAHGAKLNVQNSQICTSKVRFRERVSPRIVGNCAIFPIY